MSSFEDADSALLSNNESNLNSQALSPELNFQDMEFTFTPKEAVSNKEVIDSSTTRDAENSYMCEICSKPFLRKDHLNQHMVVHSEEKSYLCDLCEKSFARKGSLRRHKLSHLKIPLQHSCDQCSELFSKKLDLLKHRKIHSKVRTQHSCDQCSEVFSRKYELLKHKKNHKSPKQHKCVNCSEIFNHKSGLLRHFRTFHNAKPKKRDPSLKDELYEKVKHFERLNSLGVFTKTTIESNEENDKDFHTFFNSIRPDLFNELNYQMEVKRSMKWYTIMQVLVSRITQDGDTETASPHFHSKTTFEIIKENIPTHIEDAFSKMSKSFEKFTQLGSGWILEKILKLEVYSAKCGIS